MSAIEAIIILVCFAAAVWAIVTYIPMSPLAKRIIIIFAFICAGIWLASITGILGDAKTIKVPQV
jgi:hypothetical protein